MLIIDTFETVRDPAKLKQIVVQQFKVNKFDGEQVFKMKSNLFAAQ